MVANNFFDPVLAAITIFKDVRKEIEELEKTNKKRRDEIGSKLRARARDVPELIEELGLVPALSFLYSKRADYDYRLMLKAILLYLQKTGVLSSRYDVNAMIEEGRAEDLNMVDFLVNLRNKSSAIVPLLRPFLVEFKRLCEATWGLRAEGGGYEQ